MTWDVPEYGTDQLGLYMVRWYREPDHKLEGEKETRNNFYTGKSSFSIEYSITFSSFTVPGDDLDDGVLYTFQVSSISTYNYEAGSDIYEIVTPQYRIVQAITIATVGLLVLLALAAILFYMKRHLFSTYRSDDKVLD